MKKAYSFVAALAALVIVIVIAFVALNRPAIAPTPSETAAPTSSVSPFVSPSPTGPVVLGDITVNSPASGASITSPVTIKGISKGGWYFEGSFPVKVVDANGKVIGQGPAQAQGAWTTADPVPFVATITFSAPSTATGKIVFEKDNPSGLPQYDKSVSMPVRFSDFGVRTQSVKLYYQNTATTGADVCDAKSVAPLARTVPVSQAPIKDTIDLLLSNRLSQQEMAQGYASEFPLPGVALKSANLRNGTLMLEFSDPNNKLSGGSCRVGILWAQIEKTAKQFPGVNKVEFKPSELFQP